ncbi:MAG TPA: glycoside hydrolase family 43 protein [Stackebrandtia sp.]|jgi:GH43 family beta-xylosidase|uniref:glycoside hydrolase family 43 protein n=1 Tax=Stackebrandtia sp. TaxID=2023065 RepID=UPI002D6E643C|nr:glycoside hydrolase family 43 protein [Stackebrandtia sp.]HZE40384.1 glycoside hydrolase family 43 protein [Stackebrandtia sp.]
MTNPRVLGTARRWLTASRSRLAVFIVAIVAVLAATATSLVWADNESGNDHSPKATGEFLNPLNGGADPTMVYYKKNYYLSTTQGDRLSIWKSGSLGDLITAPKKDVFVDSDNSRNKQVWAPALQRFERPDGPHWYMYYTASDGTDANHRMYVIESDGDDPAGPYHFKAKIADFGEYAIDGEPFMLNGKPYFIWTGPGRGQPGPAQLYISPMSDPWTTSADRVAIPAAGGCDEVREGPTALYGKGQTFLTYSSCDTAKPDYQLWMKSIADGADPMNPDSWKQHDGPIFSRNNDAGVYGPGHHAFFKSPDGKEDWIAYLGKNTDKRTPAYRTTRAQKISWNADGTPNLGSPVAAGQPQKLPSGDPGPGVRAINDTDQGAGDAQVEYSGDWKSGNGCGNQCYKGDDHFSNKAGSTATFTFTGKQIALFSVRDVGNGTATFSIDGAKDSEPVDYYSGVRVGENPNYISPKLGAGKHTLKVTVTGNHIDSSSGSYVSIDRAVVFD